MLVANSNCQSYSEQVSGPLYLRPWIIQRRVRLAINAQTHVHKIRVELEYEPRDCRVCRSQNSCFQHITIFRHTVLECVASKIDHKRRPSTFTSAGSKKGLSMKMVAWVSGAAVGGEIAAPSWVAWQPEVTAVALGYDSTVVIFRTQPEFTRIASLSIQVSLSPSSHPLCVLLSCS